MKNLQNFLIFILMIVLAGLLVSVFVNKDDETSGEHELTHYAAVAATCTEDGTVEYWYCSDCGKYFADKSAAEELETIVVAATGHSYDSNGTCTVCGALAEGMNAWSNSVVTYFVYNGKTLSDHVIYYLTNDGGCYYIENGERIYVYTSADGVSGFSLTGNNSTSGCATNSYAEAYCIADDGNVYILSNVKTEHVAGEDGICINCGETVS